MTPTDPKSERLVVKWNPGIEESALEAIRKRFNIPRYVTINGESPVEISEEDRPLFEETARRGFFSVLHVKWCKNGEVFSFKS